MTVKLIKKREICFHETINDAENEKNYGNHKSVIKMILMIKTINNQINIYIIGSSNGAYNDDSRNNNNGTNNKTS